MKRLLLLALMILTVSGSLMAQDAEPTTDAPHPLVILKIFDPWNMVIGSDTPVFVLYDDGLVIFQHTDERGDWELASVQLDEDEKDALFEAIISGDFANLDDAYDTVLVTDQPSNLITVYEYDEDGEATAKSVSVYGSLFEPGGEFSARETAPEAYLQAFDAMTSFDPEEAETWLPEYAEIVLWPYDYSDPTAWPSDWPGLDDELTVERDSVYSVYLPIDQYDRFIELAEDASAFLIDGETWSFQPRFPLPHEFAADHAES